jgi:lysyl-tRNA synthetase class I
MEQYFTVDNIQFALIALTWAVYALRKTVQWTDNKTDDKVLAGLESAYSWVADHAPKFFFLVEELAKSGRLPKIAKAAEFLRLLQEAYQKQHNKQLPKSVETVANVYAQGQAALDKVNLLKDHLEAKIKGKISPNDEAIK